MDNEEVDHVDRSPRFRKVGENAETSRGTRYANISNFSLPSCFRRLGSIDLYLVDIDHDLYLANKSK